MFNTIKNWTCLYRFNSLYFYAINFVILTFRGSLDSWLLPTCLIKIKSRPACLDTKKIYVGFKGLTVRSSPNSRLRKNLDLDQTVWIHLFPLYWPLRTTYLLSEDQIQTACPDLLYSNSIGFQVLIVRGCLMVGSYQPFKNLDPDLPVLICFILFYRLPRTNSL